MNIGGIQCKTSLKTCPEAGFSLLMVLSLFFIILSGCTKPAPIPAQQIAGTWTTPMPVTIFMASDSCPLDSMCGSYGRYDSTRVTMTWKISYLMENLVDVVITPDKIDTTIHYDTLYGPTVSQLFPIKLRGIVNLTNLIVEQSYVTYDTLGKPNGIAYTQVGNFLISSNPNTLTGTLAEQLCKKHCYGYQSNSNLCVLVQN
jgi:hypothetical protein